MDYFIIGDLHGCYYTLLELLKNWNSDKENLIFVGDLIDRGNFSSLVVNYCFDLSKNKNCFFLKGNHELEFIEQYKTGQNDNWLSQCGQKTIDDFELHKINQKEIFNWFNIMPLKFETNHFVITHAGIAKTEKPFDENNIDGVLWNRNELKNIGKVQIHGHTPLLKKEPVFNNISNSWNIDTGAYYGFGLTGLKIDRQGEIISTITVETNKKDIE
jgi:serine/threonine protein phosphatase 1